MHCVFRDALLHTTVVMCVYLLYYHLPVGLSGPFPLTSLIDYTFCPKNSRSLYVFCYLHHSLQTLETFVHENPRRSVVLSGTKSHSTVKDKKCSPF